jgi:cytosine/adenosine deaminase-related metal-dependent hydrolase
LKGKLIKAVETNANINMKDARDRDVESMSIDRALQAHRGQRGSCNNRLHMWFSAGTPRGSPIAAHTAIGATAREHDIGFTMHCAEAPKDLSIYRDSYNCSPFQFCQVANLTGPKSVFAHCVHPDLAAGDLDILRATKSTVSNNPTSNLKLGSGVAPIPDMLAAGVNVALGTDGAPCNNTYDMFKEIHLASILHSRIRESAGLITAYQVLEMATINGAKTLGLETQIGSLEVGKKADIVIVAPKSVTSAPWDHLQVLDDGVDPVTTLVYCPSSCVDLVMVDGKVLLSQGELVDIKEDELVANAKVAIKGIRKRSGIKARTHMNVRY